VHSRLRFADSDVANRETYERTDLGEIVGGHSPTEAEAVTG
jgi:hypothetical protein